MILGLPIRVIGSKRNEIYYCCEALRSLLYPFKYAPTPERSQDYQTFISLRGHGMQYGSSFKPGLLGLDEYIVKRTDFVRESHLVLLDKDKMFKLSRTVVDIYNRSW